MTRRQLLASLLIPASLSAQTKRRRRIHGAAPPPSKLDRIGVSSRSFHSLFDAPGAVPATGERLVLLDFPQMIADRYRIHNLELAASHFASIEPAYIIELKSDLLASHSRVINLTVDVGDIKAGGGLSDPAASVRDKAIGAAKDWIDVARQAGARSVSCDPGALDSANTPNALASYRLIAAYGRSKGIMVLVESRDPIGPQQVEALPGIVRNLGGAFIGALPGFGSFQDDAARQRALPMLFTYAHTICRASGLSLDAGGNETAFNFQHCVQIAQNRGFKGIYSVDYQGTGDPYQGVQGVVNELLRFL